jgi:hypothetical protein
MSDELLAEHCWVQNADGLRAYQPRPGDTIEFLALVAAYKRLGDDRVTPITDYGLTGPTGVRITNRPVSLPSLVEEGPDPAPPPPPAPAPPRTPPPPAGDRFAQVAEVHALGTRLGWGVLREAVEVIERVGPAEVRRIVDFLGGG